MHTQASDQRDQGSLWEGFCGVAETFPDHVCMVMETPGEPASFTYREVVAAVPRISRWLADQGLQAGDAIVALLPHSAETLLLMLACARSGLKFAPLECTASQRELSRWLGLLTPPLVLTSPITAPRNLQMLEVQGVKQAMLTCDGQLSWLPAASSGDLPAPAGLPGKLCLATSGSTGEAKAIIIDLDILWHSGASFSAFLGLPQGELAFWNYLPQSYLGGLFNLGLMPFATGSRVFIGEVFSGKTLLQFWQTVDRLKLNALWVVPTVLRGLLKLERSVGRKGKEGIPPIRCCLLGTAPSTTAEKMAFSELIDCPVLESYGLSETTFLAGELPMEHAAEQPDSSIGPVLPYVQATTDPETGEILVQTPYQFDGYLTTESGLLDPRRADGWFPTGDVGHITDGVLHITSRLKDIVKKGGLLINLKDVERLCQELPEVREAAAVQVPHEFYGESYTVHVVVDEVTPALQQTVEELVHSQMSRQKWPERIVLRTDLPRTRSGKIAKSELEATVPA